MDQIIAQIESITLFAGALFYKIADASANKNEEQGQQRQPEGHIMVEKSDDDFV